MSEMILVSEFEARPQLAPYASVLAEYLGSRQSARTSQAVQERYRAFIKWAEQMESTEGTQFLSMPVDPSHVVLYAQDMDGRGLAATTIQHYLSAIGTVHRVLGFYAPTNHPEVRAFLAGLRLRDVDRNIRQPEALSEDDVARILQSLHIPRKGRGRGMETRQAVADRARIDRALLLTMIEAGLRRTEVADLVWGDITTLPDGSGLVRVPPGRTGVAGVEVAIAEDCVQALFYIRPEGVDGGECVFGLSGSQINRRLKAMCTAAGIDSDNISSRTPRITMVTLMQARGAPIDMIHRQARLHPQATLVPPPTSPPDIGEARKWVSLRPDPRVTEGPEWEPEQARPQRLAAAHVRRVEQRRPTRLNDTFVEEVDQPGRYGDGRGSHGVSLLVRVKRHGGLSKTFSQRIQVDGTERMTGLGAYPMVTLEEAREKARQNARLVKQGKDPRNVPRARLSAR